MYSIFRASADVIEAPCLLQHQNVEIKRHIIHLPACLWHSVDDDPDSERPHQMKLSSSRVIIPCRSPYRIQAAYTSGIIA